MNRKVNYIVETMGNRIMKKAWRNGATPESGNTWYVHDAQGNAMAVYKWNTPSTTPQLSEQYIYGSSRLGQMDRTGLSSAGNPRNIIGKRQYEITNHLGNVFTTLTDQPLAISNGQSPPSIAGFNASRKSTQDYYPFGMLMPGRNNSSDTYRFGFNGKEKDDEWLDVTGTTYNYGFRVYDSRIGRFLSVDPLFASYPWNSTYAFAENRVIDGIDLDETEWFPTSFIKSEPAIDKATSEGVANAYAGVIDAVSYAVTTSTHYLGMTKNAYGFSVNSLFYKDKPYSFSDGWQNQFRFWGGVGTVATAGYSASLRFGSRSFSLSGKIISSESRFSNYGVTQSFEDVSYFKAGPEFPKGGVYFPKAFKPFAAGESLSRGGKNVTFGYGRQTQSVNFATTTFGFDVTVPSYSGLSYTTAIASGATFSGLNYLNSFKEIYDNSKEMKAEDSKKWHAPMILQEE